MTIFKIFILVAYISPILGNKIPNPDDIFKKCTADADLSADLTIEELDIRMECIFACSMKEFGTMSKDGVYEAEKIIKDIPTEWPDYDLVVPALRTCAREFGGTHCKTAVLIRRCMVRTLPCLNARECSKLTKSFIFWNYTMNPLHRVN